MIKLFVTDLDGTLLNEEKNVNREDREALLDLSRAGVEICLASGRMDEELAKVMKDIGGCYHRVSQNGAFVITKDGHLLKKTAFNPELARQLYQVAKPYDLVSCICVEQTVYVKEKTDATKRIESRMFTPFIERPDIDNAISDNLAPCKLSFFGEMDRLLQMRDEISCRFPGQVDAVVADRDCIDLMPLHVSKGAGIRALIQHLGISEGEVACIGDSFNDLPMFSLTPHSFAMSHSHPEVRTGAARQADAVHQAVGWVLERNQSSIRN